MANQKLTLSKLNLKKNTNLIPLTWGEQTIMIKEYLPIQEKLDLISRIINQSLDDNNFANPARINIFTVLEVFYAYTNISFTDKQKEDFLGLFDLLMSSGLASEVFKTLGTTDELSFINRTVCEVIDEIYKYKNSALGILQAISDDYKDLDFNTEKIKENIANKENLEFLENVMKKLG